ncbi:MAG: hypothetical protein HPM95_19105 [Alphaproteobacteria bacterium]|nr:hypothetical protein [Alphaproteobacteria bacterium]
MLQPVEEFAEEASEAAGGEEGDPRRRADTGRGRATTDDPAGEDGDAEDAPAPATEDVDTAERPPPIRPRMRLPIRRSRPKPIPPRTRPQRMRRPRKRRLTIHPPRRRRPRTRLLRTARLPSLRQTRPRRRAISLPDPEAEGETAPLGETAVEEASASAPRPMG